MAEIPENRASTPLKPKELRRDGTHGLFITWQGGNNCRLSSAVLRSNCPCATCREQRGDQSHATPIMKTPVSAPLKSSLKIISSSADEELALERIWIVGNYALGMEWRDGHSTGIYPFGLLAELAANTTTS